MRPVDISSLKNPAEHIAAQTAAIHQAILRESDNLKQSNFECLGTEDLARLFDLYDRAFFSGHLAQAAKAKTGQPPVFRLSSTMTRAGGKTTFYRRRIPGGQVQAHYEIAVASRMLFMTFRLAERPVRGPKRSMSMVGRDRGAFQTTNIRAPLRMNRRAYRDFASR